MARPKSATFLAVIKVADTKRKPKKEGDGFESHVAVGLATIDADDDSLGNALGVMMGKRVKVTITPEQGELPGV